MKPSFLMAAERAIRELDVVFRESGFQASPPGLIRLLRGFVLKDNETPEEGRRRFFRRVFGILWYGNNIGKGQFRGKALPTYVYPECLKTAIRDKLSEGLLDYPNPQTSAVYTITMSDLHGAKWPGDKQ